MHFQAGILYTRCANTIVLTVKPSSFLTTINFGRVLCRPEVLDEGVLPEEGGWTDEEPGTGGYYPLNSRYRRVLEHPESLQDVIVVVGEADIVGVLFVAFDGLSGL